jgi:hypothetical protein
MARNLFNISRYPYRELISLDGFDHEARNRAWLLKPLFVHYEQANRSWPVTTTI